jgi:hypothetical protein
MSKIFVFKLVILQVLLLKRDSSTEVFADVTQPDSQP